jgi:hypothetical protein
MKQLLTSLARAVCLLAAVLPACPLAAAERPAPARIEPASSGITDAERRELVAWALSRPEVRAKTAGHRTRVLRVWSDAVKTEKGTSRRNIVLVRDYDAGVAREISGDAAGGSLEVRELRGVQPSAEEIEEGMAIVRRDPALARLVGNAGLELLGGFHNRSTYSDDPCSREICFDFAFMRPNYEGPERYVIVNLTRGVVAHHDFRGARPGAPPPRMTEPAQ